MFLGGSPPNSTTDLFPVHTCKIKEGTSILFPVVNAFCAENEVPPLNETERRICANKVIDTASELQLKIDGNEVQNLERNYRIDSPVGGFEFNAVVEKPITPVLGSSTGYSDGVWILLEKLTPGEHTITFSGNQNPSNMGENGQITKYGATYNLDVTPLVQNLTLQR